MSRTICQVIDYGGPTGGSFIPALEALSKAVVSRGEHFIVIAAEVPGASWPAELKLAGTDVHLVQSGRQVVELLRRRAPSIVHSHFTRFDLPVLRCKRNARIFWHVHSHRENSSLAARVKASVKYRIFARRVEAIVAVSKVLAAECVEFAAPRSQVRVVQNGIDTKHFRPPSRDERETARKLFGIDGPDHVVLFFERVPYKGGATLRAAMSRLPDVRLLVAGGKKADRDRFGIAPQIISIEREADARNLYWAADVLAFASDNEAFGFVLAEALACGIPVAATDIPIVHEICGSTNQVALFAVRDAPGLARAVQTLVGGGDWNGRKRMVEHFNLERWTTDMLSLYDEK